MDTSKNDIDIIDIDIVDNWFAITYRYIAPPFKDVTDFPLHTVESILESIEMRNTHNNIKNIELLKADVVGLVVYEYLKLKFS